MRRNKEFNDEDVNSSAFKKIYRRKVCNKTGKCDRCPWHGGENAGFGHKPRTDKYKNKNRRTVKYEETI